MNIKLVGKMIVHVNQALIKKARQTNNTDVPTLIVRKGSKSYYCRAVRFDQIKQGLLAGPGVVPQLDCGARTYLTIDGWVELIDVMSYRDARRLADGITCPV